MSLISKLLQHFFLLLLRLYKLTLSPLLGSNCRFHPTCSEYARDYLLLHGPWRSFFPIVYRLLRCQPWCQGGHDPVPLPK